jgi:predicted outer membrane repeat protein
MNSQENVPNERLRRARHLKGWTQSDLAEALGTDFETVSRWERGITIPSAYFREKLRDVFNKTTEELGLMPDLNTPLTTITLPLVFLASAYADAEKEAVVYLKAGLQARGISVWSSRQLRRQGVETPKKVLQEVICAAQMVLVILSPEARSSRHVRETLEMTRMYRCPVCAVWIEGEHWQECLPRVYSELYATIDARKKYDHTLLDEIIAELEQAGLPSKITSIPKDELSEPPGPHTEPRNPYKGLQVFRQEDRHDFFGRDRLIDELVQALEVSLHVKQQSTQGSRLLAVVGPSGSGKSSLVMAGLLPRLQSGGLPGSAEWIYLDSITPGRHPMESLALAFAQNLHDRSLTRIHEVLEDDSARGLHLLASHLGRRPEARVVLFVDQFEELFTQTTTEEERQRFIDVLVTANTEPDGPLFIILTLRADFYDRPAQYPELAQLIQGHHQLVLPMSIDDLREVIEKPAMLPDVQLIFEGDLVGNLLFEGYGQMGTLPLLQFTLDQLFQRRSGHQLTLWAYREIGGVKGALARYAEASYVSLPSEEHRRLARVLFLRLIDPGTTEQDTTRRRAALSELLLPDPKETIIMGEVVTTFTTARLLTTNTIAGVPTVEVSHEALIREWARLSDWLREAREDIRFQQSISEDVAEWEQRGKPRDRLYRGSQLKEAQAWARHNTTSSNEVAFLRASAVQRIRSRVIAVAMLLVVVVTAGVGSQLLLLLLSAPNPTYVTNLKDHGPGSLRLAIDVASPGSTITFATTLRGTIVLTAKNLVISKDLSIRGPGAGILAISGGNFGYSIQVLSGASVFFSGLTFKNSEPLQNSFIDNTGELTLTKSIITSNIGSNGAIDNSGTLTITNSTISNNSGYGSGGINNSGTLTITNSTISNNSGYGSGGIDNSGTLTITKSTISDNIAQAEGGGIDNSGLFFIMNSTISNNKAYGKGGGGIFNTTGAFPFGDSVSLTNSTVSGNITFGGGGGIDNSGTFTITNSTISNNKAYGKGGGIYSPGELILANNTVSDNTALTSGGGIAVSSLFYTIDFCTIRGNTATQDGGGMAFYANRAKAPFHFGNGNGIGESIVAGNHAHTSPNISGVIRSHGYNLSQYVPFDIHSTDEDLPASTFLGIDPVLRNNGGQTPTHALAPGSWAIDRIPPDACKITGITTDQRGVKRPQGNGCDIGAYEYISSP